MEAVIILTDVDGEGCHLLSGKGCLYALLLGDDSVSCGRWRTSLTRAGEVPSGRHDAWPITLAVRKRCSADGLGHSCGIDETGEGGCKAKR